MLYRPPGELEVKPSKRHHKVPIRPTVLPLVGPKFQAGTLQGELYNKERFEEFFDPVPSHYTPFIKLLEVTNLRFSVVESTLLP